METLPLYISILFSLSALAALVLFYYASKKSKWVLIVLLPWSILQLLLAYTGYYTVTDAMPPRFLLAIAPPLLLVILLFTTSAGKRFIDALDPKLITYLHTVRVPMEITLFLLFVHKLVPELMTFEGRNFDILAGLSAPFIGYYGYSKMKLNRSLMILWNFLCLGLLFNIVFHGILSAPTPFQQFAFDQPNTALMHAPFILLPALVVPLVYFSHFVCLRGLLRVES